MRFLRGRVLGLATCASVAQADLPDYQVFPADGARLLLWAAPERGRAEPELQAARLLAGRGVSVWSLDAVSACFLPQLPSSMDALPAQDMADWLRAALGSGKQVAVYAVSRAVVPVLRGAALLQPAERQRLCMLLMYSNLYTVAEALSEPDYLNVGDLSGLRVRVLQPRRAAAGRRGARQRRNPGRGGCLPVQNGARFPDSARSGRQQHQTLESVRTAHHLFAGCRGARTPCADRADRMGRGRDPGPHRVLLAEVRTP